MNLEECLSIFGRNVSLLNNDIEKASSELKQIVQNSKFLVLGGAGTIGQAVVKEIFKRDPKILHVVDINENNLVELVRDIRSSFGYIDGDFRTYALDINSIEYDAFINLSPEYDFVLNLSALKHVRSEKDPFTLMRMVQVNVLNTIKTIEQSIEKGAKKYFCVSTDKAANPVNMMGASKKIMEMFLMKYSTQINISTARFANVAFSDGSLLHGFNQRFLKKQPIVAPNDVRRYFVTPQESGELCLMSCLLGENLDIFFPKLNDELHLLKFSDIAKKYIILKGYTPYECDSETEARESMSELLKENKWPCYFAQSDTTGEKSVEEFFTKNEVLDLLRFENLGIVKNEYVQKDDLLYLFTNEIVQMRQKRNWNKQDIVDLFYKMIPDFEYLEVGKYLDSKM